MHEKKNQIVKVTHKILYLTNFLCVYDLHVISFSFSLIIIIHFHPRSRNTIFINFTTHAHTHTHLECTVLYAQIVIHFFKYNFLSCTFCVCGYNFLCGKSTITLSPHCIGYRTQLHYTLIMRRGRNAVEYNYLCIA